MHIAKFDQRKPLLVFGFLGLGAILLALSQQSLANSHQDSPGTDAVKPQADSTTCTVTSSGYYGIQHCSNENYHAIVVDLNDPHISFQTVLPLGPDGECDSVNPNDQRDPTSNCPFPYPFEKIDDMLIRYRPQGAVAVINTDYFGCGGAYPCDSNEGDHGAQGLAVRNGIRLDGRGHGVNNDIAITSPSLAISPSNLVTIGEPDGEDAIDAHLSTTYFNAVSGTPIIIDNGNTIISPCNSSYTGNTCNRTSQSVAGITSDGKLVLVTAQMSAEAIADLLIEGPLYVYKGLKFDGGGSARLVWYNRNGTTEFFDGSDRNYESARPVAAGLLVFSEPVEIEEPIDTAPLYSYPPKSQLEGFGIGSSSHLRIGINDIDQALDEVEQLGIEWIREEIPWGEVEPNQDAFRWAYGFGNKPRDFHRLLNETQNRNINILALLDYGPAYIPGPVPDDQLINRWRNYVEHVVDEFGDQIDYWEIGNEANSRKFWGKVIYPNEVEHSTNPNPDLYARMIREAYEVIKHHDQDDIVILGGLVTVTDRDCSTNLYAYLNQIRAAGAWDFFDAIAIHPYWDTNPEAFIDRGRGHEPDTGVCQWDELESINLIGEVRAIRDLAARFGPKPIWVTEIGWDNSWLERRARERGTQADVVEADYVVRTYVPLLVEPGVEKVFWYTQLELGTSESFTLGERGMQALKNTISVLSDAIVLGQVRGQDDHSRPEDDDVYEYRFRKNGQSIFVLWKARGGNVPRQVSLDNVYADLIMMYQVDAADISRESGEELSVNNCTVLVDLSERPVYLVTEPVNIIQERINRASCGISSWWEDRQEGIQSWWNTIQDDLSEWIEQRWAEIREQIEDWIAQAEQRAMELLLAQLEEWINQCCGSMVLPLGVLITWWLGKRKSLRN